MALTVADLLRYRPILDTGPLLDFLLHRFMVRYHWQRIPFHQWVILDSNAAERFGRILVRWKPIIVPTGILLELERHRQRNDLPLNQFWMMAREEIVSITYDEPSPRILDLPEVDLYRFGPVDATLLHIASRPESKPATIVTADGPLYQECLERSIRPLWIDEILSLEV